MEAAPSSFEALVASPAIILRLYPASELDFTEIAMLPPDPEADEPLPIVTAPLVPTLAVPLLKVKAPDTPELPAFLLDTDTLPELVAKPSPYTIVMDPPKAMASTPPSTVASPHDVLLAPAAKFKLPPPVVDAPVA